MDVVRRSLAAALTVAAMNGGVAEGQTFSSGSDGSDGALTLTTPGTIVFDPFDVARFGRVLDADGDGVYHFTTITIGNGVNVLLSGLTIKRPVYWLANGNVAIHGVIRLNGGVRPRTQDFGVRRQVASPGSGGYAGGAGGRMIAPSVSATAGEGPGGGSRTLQCGTFVCGSGGTFSGNRFLVPLVGGSGGHGSVDIDRISEGGGAGGGAILIASSTSIVMNFPGRIEAMGGSGGFAAGSGSGGAIRLVAPVMSGSGAFNVSPGSASALWADSRGTSGWVRLEANQHSTSFEFEETSRVSRGIPGHPSTLRPPSSVRVIAVNGVALPPTTRGSFQVADANVAAADQVTFDIEATGIPPGTVVTVQVYPQAPVDPTTVYLPAVDVTLTGTTEHATGTATIALPSGFSRVFLRANWGQ